MIQTGFSMTTARFDQFMQGLVKGFAPDKQVELYDAVALKFIELVTASGDTGTPIDTGRARAGWARAAEALGGSFQPIGEASEVAAGRKKGSTGVEKTKNSALRWIVNGVEYIVFLEYGSSEQAPAGFIRINLERLRGEIQGDAMDFLRERISEANAKARATGLTWRLSS